MSEVEALLREAKIISQEECDCRKRMQNCIEPMNGCLSFDDEASESVEKRGAKFITVGEALDSLEKTHEAGLVHMAYTFEGKDKVEVICSCCSCCCHSLSAGLRFGYSDQHRRNSHRCSKQRSPSYRLRLPNRSNLCRSASGSSSAWSPSVLSSA